MMVLPNVTATICFSTATGLISAYLAYKRGRSPIVWFIVGFFFGMLGTIALFFAPKAKEKIALSPKKIEPQPYLYGPITKFWYYVEAGAQVGPMSYDVIASEWKMGKISKETLVWHEDLTEWKPIEELIQVR